MIHFLAWFFSVVFVLALIVVAVGIYVQMRDNKRKRVTGHWVEHSHKHGRHMVPWVQPVTSATAAQLVTATCNEVGFPCTAHESETFNVERRTARA